jgi:hypothetical protein
VIPINNSDLSWLIVSDYNQDNGKFYEELREDVLNPATNLWIDGGESTISNIGGGYILGVGNGIYVPGDYCAGVGDGVIYNIGVIGGYSWMAGGIGDRELALY